MEGPRGKSESMPIDSVRSLVVYTRELDRRDWTQREASELHHSSYYPLPLQSALSCIEHSAHDNGAGTG